MIQNNFEQYKKYAIGQRFKDLNCIEILMFP